MSPPVRILYINSFATTVNSNTNLASFVLSENTYAQVSFTLSPAAAKVCSFTSNEHDLKLSAQSHLLILNRTMSQCDVPQLAPKHALYSLQLEAQTLASFGVIKQPQIEQREIIVVSAHSLTFDLIDPVPEAMSAAF